MKNFDKKLLFIIIPLILISCALIYIFSSKQNSEIFSSNELYISNNPTETEIENTTIIIHIDGEVVNPGIVELPTDARISDAISMAGGLTELSNISNVNLAYKLSDGQKIHIPSIYDTEVITYIQNDAGNDILITDSSPTNSLVNINSASKTELETLPGIGASTATKIIDYRSKNGKFKTIEDIMNVSGIGEAKFSNIKDYICI